MQSHKLYHFGPFCLDAVECVLLRDGRLVPLPPKALLALLVLVRNSGHVVDKDVLLDEVWPDQDVEEGNLSQNVFMVRKALGESIGNPKYIETVPRRGYRFVGLLKDTGGASTVSEGNFKHSSRRYTESPEAYQSYLQGRYSWSKHTKEGLEQAIGYFQRAIDLDPTYALASAALVDCHLRLATNYFPPADVLPTTAAAIQSGEKDDSAHEVQALIEMRWRLDRMTMERDIRRAIDLGSNYPLASQWHSGREFILKKLGLPSPDANRDDKRGPANANLALQLESSPTRDEQIKILCTIAQHQIDVGNFEAGCIILKDWWTMGQWPKLERLDQHSSANLLFIAGTLACGVACARPVPRGTKNAEELLNGSIALFEQLGLKTRAAEARAQLGYCYMFGGVYDLARYTLSSVLKDLDGEPEIKGRALVWLGDIGATSWHLKESFARLHEVRELLEDTSILVSCRYHQALASAFFYQAVNKNQTACFDRAIQHYEEALHQTEVIGHHRTAGKIENNYGFLLAKLKRFDTAEFYLSRARKRLQAFQDTYTCARVDDSLAQLRIFSGEYETALQDAKRAVDAAETSSQQVYLAEDLVTQGIALCRLGRLREAKQTLHQAYYVAERCGDFDQAGSALVVVIEEMFAHLEENERWELAHRVNQLLARLKRSSTRERLTRCLKLIAA